MTATEYAVGAFFILVALFGVVDAIRTPLVIKRQYRDKGFTDKGRKTLASLSSARILDGQYTEHFYSDCLTLPGVSQCKAWSTDRRKFTISKATRKRNRAAWSITVVDMAIADSTMVDGDWKAMSCLVLPTVVPEAIAYVGDGRDINFSDSDVAIANRYHITASDESAIRSSILVEEVREFLLQPDVIFMELTDQKLVLKRNWSDHRVLDRLDQELQVATQLAESLK